MRPSVDVVLPVLNEERVLAASVRRLHDHLEEHLPFPWRIVIADNGSSDATPQVARALAGELPGVASMHVDPAGRGGALRAAWLASPADVVAYMDVDLSTDLGALLPLLAPLVSGHSDVAIGSRLAPGARIVRGAKRELISRAYNRLLRAALAVGVSDAQCGFKALRADAARRLLPEVRDDGWFFDTELLVAAQRAGLRIHEVPVDWIDDPDSSVDIRRTALGDLRGIARLLAGARLTRFLAVGIASTLAYALLFLALRGDLGAGGANGVALALTAVANTQANRGFAFGVRGRRGLARHHALGGIVFVLTLALTSGALAVLHGLDRVPSHAVELAVLVTASLCATATRYVALRSWVFAPVRCRGVLRRAFAPIERS